MNDKQKVITIIDYLINKIQQQIDDRLNKKETISNCTVEVSNINLLRLLKEQINKQL